MKKSDDAKTLRWIEGFRELSPQDIRRIGERCLWKWYRPNQSIFSQSDVSTDVFFIVQGTVRITNFSVTGKQVSFRDLSTGQCFGDLAAVDGLPRSATAVAQSDAYVASMSAEGYWDTLRSHPAVTAACLKRLASLVRSLSDRVIEHSLLPVAARVELELLRLAQRGMHAGNSAKIDPAPTHAEIASRVATHREAVTRELRRLAGSGIIAQEGRKIIILDVNALRSALNRHEEVNASRA
jgi:CRP-like cAMP-binding protein